MIAVVIGQFVPVVVGWLALRHARTPGEHSDRHSIRPMIRETVLNSQALLAFFALSNADVIVARNVLDEHDAGLYAGGLILTKAVLRSEEHTSELQSLMRISYAVFCLKKKK